jgi:hypothetical protein
MPLDAATSRQVSLPERQNSAVDVEWVGRLVASQPRDRAHRTTHLTGHEFGL